MSILSQWLSLLGLMLLFIGVAAGIFVFVATMIGQNFGSKTVLPLLAIYVPLVTVSCIYKLGGLSTLGVNWVTAGMTLSYVSMMLSMVGLPLLIGAIVLKRLTDQRPSKAVGLQMAMSWAASVAAVPIGIATSLIVQRMYGP